MEVHVYIMA